jgi:hypothetical protein
MDGAPGVLLARMNAGIHAREYVEVMKTQDW